MDMNQGILRALRVEKTAMFVILMLIVLVAAFDIVTTLVMVVMEKRKDIAVLMAMGATAGDIRRIFVLKGLIVGAIGTAAGLAIGGLGCFIVAHYHFIHIQREIYGMSSLPVDVQPISFVLVAIASLLLCLLATFYPSRQAANALPVEVFRS
jgi:lipoprotein-releasing system permease protein